MVFEDLKTVVTTAPVLVSPQDLEPFRVEADSSDLATGAVLSQQSMTDGKWHPVAFYSKSQIHTSTRETPSNMSSFTNTAANASTTAASLT